MYDLYGTIYDQRKINMIVKPGDFQPFEMSTNLMTKLYTENTKDHLSGKMSFYECRYPNQKKTKNEDTTR